MTFVNYSWIYSLQLHIDLTSHLEFSSETVVFYSQFTHLVVNHCFDEGLDAELEIAGSKQNISPDVFMDAGVLLKECLNIFSIDPALLMASIVEVCDIMTTQERSEVLRVPEVLLLHNIADFYISILPFVSTGQSKEDVKRPTILKHRLEFHPLDTPIPKLILNCTANMPIR